MLTSTLLDTIEQIWLNRTRSIGPQFSGFIFDYGDKKILNIEEIFKNKNKYIKNSNIKFLPHYSVVGEINDIRVFNTFTSQNKINFNNTEIKNLELDHIYFDYTTPLGFDINNIIDNYYIFYDIDCINKYITESNNLFTKFIKNKINEYKTFESLSIEIFRNELIINKKLDDLSFYNIYNNEIKEISIKKYNNNIIREQIKFKNI